MTMQNPQQQNQQPSLEEDPGTHILKMFNEVQKTKAKWEARHKIGDKTLEGLAKAHEKLAMDTGMTIFSFMHDIVYHLGQQFTMIVDLDEKLEQAGLEPEEQTTQFTPEDAAMFSEVMAYALGLTEKQLEQPGLSDESRGTLHGIRDRIAHCNKLIEENTLQDQDDDEEVEDDEADEPAALASNGEASP